MGYTTEFEGQFNVVPVLKEQHRIYLNAFSQSRRMKRDPFKASALYDPFRIAVDLPIGDEGCFYVGTPNRNGDRYGQTEDGSISDYNKPSYEQPSLWCNWIPTDDGAAIEWSGIEKFHEYIPWIEYLIEKFLKPWGYVLNGTVLWQGEDITDRGKITISNNVLSTSEESEVISIPGIPIELAEYIAIEIGGDREEILQAIYAFIKDKE